MTVPHPLDPVTPADLRLAVKILCDFFHGIRLRFKFIDIYECPKNELIPFLECERLGNPLPPPPNRRARVYFHKHTAYVFEKAIVNLTTGEVELAQALPDSQGPLDYEEFKEIEQLCNSHPAVLNEIEKLKLPAGAKCVNDPWSYGTDNAEERRRLFQCYMYIVLNDDPEANYYSLPAPISPVFDGTTKELLWIDHLPMSADKNPDTEVQPWDPVEPVEYAATLLGRSTLRTDLKPLQVIQPDGPSFEVSGRQVAWQKWRFTLGWTLREGPVLKNVVYDGRLTFHRLSLSELTVPYGDPRPPLHRKQAFDLGNGGFGLTSNSLRLGCDCLGYVKYFDGCRVTADGEPVLMPNVVCMHEVDAGIGWKHTNFRSRATSVVRNRQLVIQCTATVGNYEYILAFILDQAAGIHFEIRATGIVSTMPIRKGVQVPWGITVAPGALAVNHQHLFNIRIDPAIDGYRNTVVREEFVAASDNPETDPFGVGFKVKETTIKKAGGFSLKPETGRLYKIQNSSVINEISKIPVSYKLYAMPSQMLMMGDNSFGYKRGIFASKPIWVTKYRDDELWAAGEFTIQSRKDTGLGVWAARDDDVENEDLVLWHTFGLTHVPQPEDFPVMPVEIVTISLKPSNFFTSNPSNDVPRSNN